MKQLSYSLLLVIFCFNMLVFYQCDSPQTRDESSTSAKYVQDDLTDASNAGISVSVDHGMENTDGYKNVYHTYINSLFAILGLGFVVFIYWQFRQYVGKGRNHWYSN